MDYPRSSGKARTRRARLGVGVLAIAAVALFGSVAWACTPQSIIYPVTPIAAPPMEKVVVAGELLQPGPAEIRWNALNGPNLAAVEKTDAELGFSVEATLPEVSPGVYYLLLVSGDKVVARSAVEVTAPRSRSGFATPDLFTTGLDSSAPSDSDSSGRMLLVGVGLLAAGLVVLSAVGLAAPRRTKRVRLER